MLECNEVKIRRILNQTAIDLGEYVINPFMGCELACLYCYVRSNRVVSRKNKPWGTYVDVRMNAPELLEKEILTRRPKTVLLGSTTECFQPLERQYHLSRRMLEILNKHKVFYTILTRSPQILENLNLLKEGFCKNIYFTVNNIPREFKLQLEPKSPGFELREAAVKTLLAEGIPVVPYFSPILPWVSDFTGIFSKFPEAEEIGFECLNFQLANIDEIICRIGQIDTTIKGRYERMRKDREFYTATWRTTESVILDEAKRAKKRYTIFVHTFGDYFITSEFQ